MAHVKLYRDKDNTPRLEINGVDFTNEIYADCPRVTSTGDDEFAEVAVEIKFGLSRLDIGDHLNVDAALLVGSALARMAAPVPTPLERIKATLDALDKRMRSTKDAD
jgi:hypothetical protein